MVLPKTISTLKAERCLIYYRESDLKSLFVGKTGFEFKPLLDELITREILRKPDYLPKPLTQIDDGDPIINFMLNSIK